MKDDVTDGMLVNLGGVAVAEVPSALGESGLDRALKRILDSDRDDAFSSFQASIG